MLKVLKRTRRIGQGRTVVYERTHFPSNTADPDDHLQRGHVLALRAHGPGEWSSEAKNEAPVVLEKEPDSHEAICLLGRIAEKERHVEAAGDYYIFALERNPNYPLAKQDLARVISQLLPIRQIERWGSEEVSPGEKSRFDKALRIYEKALKKGITFLDYPSLHHRLALGFWRSLEKTNALEQESLALRLDPQEPEYHYWKGRILEELRATAVRNEQILKEYNAAIELVEKSGKISGYERSEKSHIYHQRKRALLLRLGKIDEAVKETLAIPQNWSLPEQLIECSVRYAMDSKWDAAESLLVRAMKDGHVDNRTLFYRALGQRNQSRGRNRIVLTKLLESEKLSTMFRPRSSN